MSDKKTITLLGLINGQKLRISQPVVVSDTISFIEMKFQFSEEWDGLIKVAHFRHDGEEDIVDFILEDDRITKDKQLNFAEGQYELWIHGYEIVDGNKVERGTTTKDYIIVETTGELNGEDPVPVPPSIGEQILATAYAAKDTAEEALEKVSDVVSVADEAKETSDEALLVAQEAKEIAEDAYSVAGEADNAANEAIYIAQTASDKVDEAILGAEQANETADAAVLIAQSTESKAANAETAARNAVIVAQESVDNANTALNKSQGALTEAQNAKNIANTAYSKADDAIDIANGAVSLVVEAKEEAQNAEETSQVAVDTANLSKIAANNAVDAANVAITKANQAYSKAESTATVARHADENASNAIDIANAVKKDADDGKFDGKQGDPGEPGYTPVKGVDYYTAEEKNEIIDTLSETVLDNALYTNPDETPEDVVVPTWAEHQELAEKVNDVDDDVQEIKEDLYALDTRLSESIDEISDDVDKLADFPKPVNPLTESNFSRSMTTGDPTIVYTSDGIAITHGNSNATIIFVVPVLRGKLHRFYLKTVGRIGFVQLQNNSSTDSSIIDKTNAVDASYVKEFTPNADSILVSFYVSYSVHSVNITECGLLNTESTPVIKSDVLPFEPVYIDETLSESGKAADSKVVGDKITEFAERFDSVFVPPSNRISVTNNNLVIVNGSNQVITTSDGWTSVKTGSNGNYGFIFDTIVGKQYEISMKYTGKYAPRVMGNYAYPAKPQYDSADYRLIVLEKDDEGIYRGSFTATYQECVLFVYQSYSESVTASEVFCKLSTDHDSIGGEYVQKASENAYGVVKLGSGFIEEDGVVSLDSRRSVNPVLYGGKDFSVYSTCLCIGDSLTMGVFNTTGSGTGMDGTATIPKYSYPTQLEKISGVHMDNWGIGGYTSRQWYEAKSSEDWSGHDVAIIALGTNDAAKSDTVAQAGTALNAIIAKLKSENKGIKIFMCTLLPAMMYNTQKYNDINNQIKNIANNTADCYLIDMTEYSVLARGTAYENGHLTAIGYMREAEELYAYIGHIMHNNSDEFDRVQFIGTSY